MSLAECADEELIEKVFINLIKGGDYLGVLGYYFSLPKEMRDFIKKNNRLNTMLDLAIDETPYQKAHY